ncbi:MAG: hypothetical protein LIP77_06070, partial [Planctomycetes bacterium]|nr:hypothetical protein [Planctomycetota bacterium]
MSTRQPVSDRVFYSNTAIRRRKIPDGVTVHSIFEEASREAYRHKWIESEKAGYDIGDGAIEDWHRRFWHKFVRERWIQHIKGDTFWHELDNDDFGILDKEFADCRDLSDTIVAKLENGGENLDIIQWAVDNGQDMKVVLHILGRLD